MLADFTRLRVLPQGGAVRAWAWALFLENSSAKLGVALDDDNDEKLKSFPPETLDDEALSTLHKWYVTKLGQKKDQTGHAKLQPCMDGWKSRADKAKEEALAAGRAAEKGGHKEPQQAAPPAAVTDWKEGDVAIALPGKRKSEFDNQEGVVLKVLAKKLRLEFKRLGETKDVDKDRCQKAAKSGRQNADEKAEEKKEEKKEEKPSLTELLGSDVVDD